MKHILAATAAAALLLGTGAGFAQNAPGQQFNANGSVSGHAGASGYAPGIQMQEKGSVKGTTGASGYAPGHATTGAGVNSSANVKAGGVNGKADIKAGAKMK